MKIIRPVDFVKLWAFFAVVVDVPIAVAATAVKAVIIPRYLYL